MTRYFVYDVFTQTRFAGNQLAVIPDASNLAEENLQSIAREFNFSETTFVYPPSDPANTARVRIFTPTMEVPFAGHPTIGTAFALRYEGHKADMVLELGIGPIPCTFDEGGAAFTVSAPLETFGQPDIALTAQSLTLPEDAIVTSSHPPIQASVGLAFTFVELRDKAALSACVPSVAAFREGAARYPTPLDFAIFAYVKDGDQIDARMFAPLDDIPEDPATGSACSALAALLTDISGKSQSLSILQGEAMGRPSLIGAKTVHGNPISVTISGHAVRTMEGQLLLSGA